MMCHARLAHPLSHTVSPPVLPVFVDKKDTNYCTLLTHYTLLTHSLTAHCAVPMPKHSSDKAGPSVDVPCTDGRSDGQTDARTHGQSPISCFCTPEGTELFYESSELPL